MARATVRFGGVAVASVAAGPLFVLGAAISIPIQDPAAAIPVDIALDETSVGMILLGLPVALILLMFFGGIIAVVPNLIGSAALTWLGERNPGTQLPAFWALVGATAFAAPAAALSWTSDEASPGSLIPFVFTGACCALICRRGLEKERAA